MRFQFNPFTDKLDISGMGPGATSVDFVTGNSGGIVSADANYNINILGDNTSGLNTIGNLSPSTLTIFGLASSTTQIGTTRYATNSEAAAQSIGTAALTPSNITSLFSTNYLPSSQGGTGLSSPAAHSLIVTNGSSAYTTLGVASNGQIPIGSIASDPVLNTITAGTNITVTNGPGTITIASTASVPTTFTEDSGTATPALNNLNLLGSGSITTSGSGSTVTTALTGLTNHNVLLGAGTSTITKVAPSSTSGVPLISQGAASDPAFGVAVVAGGGTGANSFNINGVVVSNTTTTGALAGLTLANGQLIIGSTGATPVASTLTSSGGTITITPGAGTLNIDLAGGTVGIDSFSPDSGTDPVVPTGAGLVNMKGSGSITTVGSLNTLTTQLTGLTNHAILVGAGTSTITKVGPTATAGQVLQSAGSSADPAFSTSTYPATATGTGTILRADGTNWAATTSTYPNTNAVSTLLYASSANVMSALTTANNGTLVTSNTGVPSILAGPGTTGNILQSNSAAPPSFSTATYPSTATGTGTILRANGTNWVPTTATYPTTAGTSGNVLTSDGTNWTSAAPAGGGVTGPGSSTDRAISTWNGTGGTVLFNNSTVKIDSTGRQTNTTQPCFSAYLSSAVTNVTGDGTSYIVAYDSTNFDQGSNFNTSTNKYVAPVAGKYLFTGIMYIQNLGVAHTNLNIILGNVTTAVSYYCWINNPVVQAVSGVYNINFSKIISCAASDNIDVVIVVSGSTKTVGLLNGAAVCNFDGYLLC